MEDKDKLIAELKAENELLKEELATYGATGVCEVCSDKANKLADKYLGCLQEIKEIAEQILNKNEFVYMSYRDVRQIIRLITKAEREG